MIRPTCPACGGREIELDFYVRCAGCGEASPAFADYDDEIGPEAPGPGANGLHEHDMAALAKEWSCSPEWFMEKHRLYG